MADWYVSSAAYAAVPVWVATHAYTVGQIVKPTAPATGREYVFRCTTAGTSSGTEPTWSSANGDNATRTDGTVTWTNVSGQVAYGWSAAAGTLWSLATAVGCRPNVGDRVFLSSDHSESFTSVALDYGGGYNGGSSAFGLIQHISVNRAGSVPPVAADVQNGATINCASQTLNLNAMCNVFWQGVTFAPNNGNINFNGSGSKTFNFKNCAFAFAAAAGRMLSQQAVKIVLDNCTVQFGTVGAYIGTNCGSPFELAWINTPSAVQGATIPTNLFSFSSSGGNLIVCRGVDLSAVTTTLVTSTTSGNGGNRLLLDSCRIAAGVTRLATPSNSSLAYDEVELVNCFDGTNVLNERYTPAGAVTTDRSTTLSGGAQDDVGGYSLKLVSSSRADKFALPLDSFWLDVENALVGSACTAVIEVISSASLNNDDVRLFLEYMGTGGSAVASFADSLASVLTASAALTTSVNTWNNPPGTPVKQLLQVPFTPQTAGRVRGLVRLGKPSTTVWVNPQIRVVVATVQTLASALVSDGDTFLAPSTLRLTMSGTPATTGTEYEHGVGSTYAGFTVTASGGTAPYTYSVLSGALPSGITVNSSTGAVSGTPGFESAGVYSNIVIRATDSLGTMGDLAPFTLTIAFKDPYWSNVNFLLDYDAANGNTTFTDAVTGTNMGGSGNIHHDTTVTPLYGTSSLMFDGSTAGLLMADSPKWDLGSSIFTLDFTARPTNITGNRFWMAQWENTPTLGWVMFSSSDTVGLGVSTTGSNSLFDLLSAAGTIVVNTWARWRVDFDGTKYRLYKNGTMIASSTTLRTINNSTQQLAIGSSSAINGSFFTGNCRGIRITKGTARTASDGGYTISNRAFPTS